MTWLRVVVPVVAVVAVFAVGVVLDGPDLRGDDWLMFLGFGILLPAVLLALGGASIAFGVYCLRDAKKHGQPSAWGERPMSESPAQGHLYAVGAFVLGGLGLTVVGVLIGVCPPHNQNGRIGVMSLWLATAVGVGAIALLALLGWGLRRTWIGRGLLVVSVAAVAVAVWQAGGWWRCWEATRYEWYKDRAFAAGWKTDEQKAALRYWAERMIAHRPDDWRGYAQRADAYDLGTDGDAVISDIETALRLGCSEPGQRALFGEKFSNLGRFVEAAREYDAAAIGYTAARKDHWERDADRCAVDAAFARLDANDLNAVSEWAAARRRADPNDIAATFLLARVNIARGESAAACDLVRPLVGKPLAEDGSWLLAWVLATSHDPAVRDVPAARKLVTDYLRRIDDERAELERNPPRIGRQLREDNLTALAASGNLVLAACDAADGEFNQARQHLAAWREYNQWDRLPHHGGFWGTRFTRLDECVRTNSPYRDEPAR